MTSTDSVVEDDDVLYKHSPEVPRQGWVIWDEGDGVWQVQSGAFQWHDDGVSSYQDSVLISVGLTWEDVKREPKNGVFKLDVSAVRGHDLDVRRDPNPGYIAPADLQPRDEAHALIVETAELSRRQMDKKRRLLAKSSVVVHIGDPPPEIGTNRLV